MFRPGRWGIVALSCLTGLLVASLQAVEGPSPGVGDGPAPIETAVDEAYRVGPGDILLIEVYDEKQLSGDFTVDATGRLGFPLLGDVAVAGATVREVRDRLTELLAKDYLFNPQVSVTVKEHRSKKVEVLGSVEKPGVYYLDRPLRLFDLLARAGGISDRLGQIRRGQMLRISRRDAAGLLERRDVDLYDLLVLGADEANVSVLAGDVIYIPENQSVHVIGEVKNPGSFPYEVGMTVLKAITVAGGPNRKAALKRAVIRRIRGGKEERLKVGVEEVLEPEDIVEVEKSFW